MHAIIKTCMQAKNSFLYHASFSKTERWKGVEPSTFSLGRRHSTAELPSHGISGGERWRTTGVQTPLETTTIIHNPAYDLKIFF